MLRVEIYWNLHLNLFSVRALEGRAKGKVIAHARDVLVRDPQFVVQKAGRERVLREGRKNVHAFVRGQLESMRRAEMTRAGEEAGLYPIWTREDRHYEGFAVEHGTFVTYNPERFDSFQTARHEGPHETHYAPIKRAPMVLCASPTLKGRRRGTMFAFDPCVMPVNHREAA